MTVADLAQEVRLSVVELLDLLNSLGCDAETALSPVAADDAGLVRAVVRVRATRETALGDVPGGATASARSPLVTPSPTSGDVPEHSPPKFRERLRRSVANATGASPEARVVGSVKWFNKEKGFGFINQSDGTEVFVHRSALAGTGSPELADSAQVEFRLDMGDRGPVAREVVPFVFYSALEEHFAARGIYPPQTLLKAYLSSEAVSLGPLLYWPDINDSRANTLDFGLALLGDAFQPPPPHFLPLLPVDDMSIACVVCSPSDSEDESTPIVRWHLGAIASEYQGALLDTDVGDYLQSVFAESRRRDRGLQEIEGIARRYLDNFVAKGARPRKHELRPVQLACQNVIVGMAAMQQDPTFDGLRVTTYLTCEAPHVATNEPDRAMAALILCDAFQSGGTMEVRFGKRSREQEVPPSLQRFGRVNSIALGLDDPLSISPREARELFWLVTRMPAELGLRCDDIVDRGVLGPERLCYTLMAAVWEDIALDYLLAVSSRVDSILTGGAPLEPRSTRLAELEACRAALMAGMLRRHLERAKEHGATSEVVVTEDSAERLEWTIHPDFGAVEFFCRPACAVGWAGAGEQELASSTADTLIVVPRGLPTPEDASFLQQLSADNAQAAVVLLVPSDMSEVLSLDTRALVCPDRLAQLDMEVQRRLEKLRVGRR